MINVNNKTLLLNTQVGPTICWFLLCSFWVRLINQSINNVWR